MCACVCLCDCVSVFTSVSYHKPYLVIFIIRKTLIRKKMCTAEFCIIVSSFYTWYNNIITEHIYSIYIYKIWNNVSKTRAFSAIF